MPRLVSYNIQKGIGVDLRRRPGRTVEVLREIDADIIVLQEADRRFGSRTGVLPLKRMGILGYELVTGGARKRSHGWHGNAVFVREGLGPVRTAHLDLPSFEPRGAVVVDIPKLGCRVVGAHLSLVRRLRHSQIATLCSAAKGPTIVAGDFNERGTIDPRFGEIITPGPSFHAARPTADLDRFIMIDAHARSAHVHQSKLSRWASDHLPVVLEFEV